MPLLHLDGTDDHAMAEAVFGRMRHENHRVERSPADRGDLITQIVGPGFYTAGLRGCNKRGGEKVPFTGDWKAKYDEQRAGVLATINARPGALTIASKSVVDVLKAEAPDATFAHFNALRGVHPIIPWKSNRKAPGTLDRRRYARRNCIERMMGLLKHFRRVAT